MIHIIDVEQEINIEMIKRVLNKSESSNKIIPDDLFILSKEFKVGFCLVTKQLTKRLEHEVIIAIDRNSDDLPMILLYQTDLSVIHIIRKHEDITTLSDLQSKLFLKYMNILNNALL